MKKTLITMIIITLLILSACADNSGTTSVNSTNESGSSRTDERTNPQPINTTPEEFEKAEINTLGLFIFLAENTEYAINAEQAQEMLVLWQVGKSLIESSTAADAELDIITKQISGLFSVEQIEYLMSVDMVEVNLMDVLGEYGLVGRGGQGDLSIVSDEDREAMRAAAGGDFGAVGGTRPGGGQGGGPGGGLGGQEITPEMQATREAMREEMGGAGFGMNTAIFDSVILLLESKIE